MPTPNIALTSLEAAQAQKHITVNEAFARIDAAIHLSVLNRTQTAPPSAPSDGDRYLIASPASDGWATHENSIAAWDASALTWHILAPKSGWRVWVEAESLTLIHTGTSWSSFAGSQLGVNASADAVNRLAVASDAVLLNHDGAGMQAKLNKAAATDTAALVFQSGFNGHAELGLAGDNDLHLKTSPDGVTFTEAMVVDAATARPSFPQGAEAGGLSLSQNLAVNLLPDAGRFGGEAANASLIAASFVAPGYLSSYNGGVLSGHGRFAHNTSTYGGSGAALNSEVQALHELLRPASARRFGPEWWALKIAHGTGTAGSRTEGGISRSPALYGLTTPMPQAFTVGFYLRVTAGSGYVDQDLTSRFARWGTDETGNTSAGVVTPADGWVFFERQMSSGSHAYNFNTFRIFLESNAEAFVALPRLLFGHVELDPLLPGPLPNARLYG